MSFGRKLVRGFQTAGAKLGVGSPNFGRKVVNSVKTINSTLQRLAPIATLIAPSFAPAIGAGLALSQATTSAVQSGASLAKSTRSGADNGADLAKFSDDFKNARSGYAQLGSKGGIERLAQSAPSAPALQFA